VLSRLKEARFCGRVGEYIFSDVSPAFLRLGNRAIMEAADEDFNYALKKLDFNRPLCEQGMRAADIDVVYGVNSLHVAKSLVGSLKYIYDVLKPEGLVIFCECCRPAENYLLSQEIIFNLLDTYVNVDLDKDLRPLPGFLDYGHWKKNLESAGFKNIEVLFNTDACYTPDLGFAVNPLAAVIKAER
jgi:SAM-dependent methyltransferase